MGMGQVMPIPKSVPARYPSLAYPAYTHFFSIFIPIPTINRVDLRRIFQVRIQLPSLRVRELSWGWLLDGLTFLFRHFILGCGLLF